MGSGKLEESSAHTYPLMILALTFLSFKQENRTTGILKGFVPAGRPTGVVLLPETTSHTIVCWAARPFTLLFTVSRRSLVRPYDCCRRPDDRRFRIKAPMAFSLVLYHHSPV